MIDLFDSVYLFFAHRILKIVCVFREFYRFLGTQTEKALITEAVSKKLEYVILQLGVKIYQHIPTQDQVHFSKNTVCDQVVIGENDIPL